MSDNKEPKMVTPNELLTPEAQAFMNRSITAAVREVFAGIGPILESIALTPEKLAAAEALRRAPDAAKVAREKRERKLMAEELNEANENKKRLQESCPHVHPNGASSCSLVMNYPDRQPRAVCMVCHCWFEPKHWEIAAPDAENPRGRPFIAPAHPQYLAVVKPLMAKAGV